MVKIEFVTPQLRNYRQELFEKLNKQYDVKFVFTGYKENSEFAGMSIPHSWNYEKINILYLKRLSGKAIINWVKLTKALLTDPYDLILSSPAEGIYNLIVLLVSKLRFKKIVFWGEGWYWGDNILLLRLYHAFVKWMLEHGDSLIAMGGKPYEFYQNILQKKNGVFRAPKYVVPFRKTDASKLIDNLARDDSQIVGKKIILYMSQIIRRKGLDYLIRAFSSLEKKHDDVFLLIVGSGEFEAYCRRLAKELNIKNIMFKGYVPESDIELYHNVCDVLVLPSIFLNDYPEPNGYVLYESMSVGKPLIVTDAVGAVPELVKNEINGFVVKNKDVAELEVALSKIIASKKLREKMSKNSRELFKEKISLEGQFDAFRAAIEYATQSAGSIERNT